MSLKWTAEVGEADWWVANLRPFARDVGALVTGAYPAVARIFHPVIGDFGRRRRWRDVALATGRVAHPAMQFEVPCPVVGGSNSIGRPRTGTLPPSRVCRRWSSPHAVHDDRGPRLVRRVGTLRAASAAAPSWSAPLPTAEAHRPDPLRSRPPYVLSRPRVEAPIPPLLPAAARPGQRRGGAVRHIGRPSHQACGPNLAGGRWFGAGCDAVSWGVVLEGTLAAPQCSGNTSTA